MTAWMKNLSLELSIVETKDILEPQQEVGPHDKKVGKLNEELKKLYSLWMGYSKSCEQMTVDARYSNPSQETLAQIRELSIKSKALYELFWISIRDTYGLWGGQNVGVRRGYVVVIDTTPQSPFMQFFQFGPDSP